MIVSPGANELSTSFDSIVRDLEAWVARKPLATEAVERLREALKHFEARAEELKASWNTRELSKWELDFIQVVDRIREALPDPNVKLDPAKLDAALADLREVQDQLHRLLDTLPEAAKPARPMNLTRSLFHFLSGVGVVALAELVNAPTAVALFFLAFAAFGWGLELTRSQWPAWNRVLMWVLSPIAHDHEHVSINSATWYTTALAVLFLTASGPAAHLGILALAAGDPMAGIIGRKFGRTKLVGNKSLEGTLAFAVAATGVGLAYLLVLGHFTWGPALLLATTAALVGAVTELITGRVDDNLSVPVAAGWAAALAMLLL